eukprot:COSAG02_NODE_712_length_18122_cov_6.792321_10_plen_116_part_00
MTLLLIVAVTAAFQLLGHCCCAEKGQSGLPAGAARAPIPLAQVVSSGSMQNQRWGDVVSDRTGEATAAAVGAAPAPTASAKKGGQQEQEQTGHHVDVDDSNFAIADSDGDEYEEF